MNKNRFVSFALALIMIVSMAFCAPLTASAAETYTVTVDTSKYFTIKNVGAGKYLNVYKNSSANNTNVTLWAADGTSGEDFKFAKSGSNYIMVPRCATSRAVNIYTASNAKSGNNVVTWSKSGHSTQAWIIEYVVASKAFIFRSANNKNIVLTAAGSKNGSNVSVATYSAGNKHQLWTSSALKAAVNKSGQAAFTKKNYLQIDSKWNTKTYNNSYLKDSGCGPFSLVNAVYNATSKLVDPYEVADWAYGKKYFNQSASKGGGVCNHKIFTEAASKFGADYGFKYDGYGTQLNSDALKNHLKNGGTAVVHVTGHYMTLVGYDASSGKFLVFDPAPGTGTNYNSTKRSGLTSPNGDWKTVSQLSTGNLTVTEYWMYSKK